MGLLRDKLLLLGRGGRGWLGAGDGDMGTSAASFLYSFTGLRKNISGRLRDPSPDFTQPSPRNVVNGRAQGGGLTTCGSGSLCVCAAYASALRNPQNPLLPDIFVGQFRDLPPWRLRVYLRRVARQHLATSHLTTRTIRSCVNFTRFTQPRNVHGLCPQALAMAMGEREDLEWSLTAKNCGRRRLRLRRRVSECCITGGALATPKLTLLLENPEANVIFGASATQVGPSSWPEGSENPASGHAHARFTQPLSESFYTLSPDVFLRSLGSSRGGGAGV